MQRPTAVSIFGYLNIVFAVFALFGAFGAFSLQLAGDDSKNPIVKLMHENQAYATWVKCTIPMDLLSFAFLLTAGIGLLRLSEWARKLSIAYGIYAILMDIAVAAANFVFLRPMLAQTSFTDGAYTAPAATAAVIGAIMGGVFGLIYPVVLIVFMMRREIAAAFRPPAEPPVLPAI
jgi:hypothetical protein